MTTFARWPKAVISYGYYPPEMVLQVPMDVFRRCLDEAPSEKHPEWKNRALSSGMETVLMHARVFYGLVGDSPPEWMKEQIEDYQGQ